MKELLYSRAILYDLVAHAALLLFFGAACMLRDLWVFIFSATGFIVTILYLLVAQFYLGSCAKDTPSNPLRIAGYSLTILSTALMIGTVIAIGARIL